MIPKIIHYVWIGDNPKPQSVLKCIETWKKYCPDYTVVEWNDSCLSEINNVYVKEALEKKKYAFASDYIRLKALYDCGGFYFDTDLELVNNIDEFCDKNFIVSNEKYGKDVNIINTAFIGASKGLPLIAEFLGLYKNLHFVINDKNDTTTNVARLGAYIKNKYHISDDCCKGLQQCILEKDHFIYPYFYFCQPLEGKKSYAIHHFDGTWKDDWKRKVVFTIGKYSIVKFRNIKKEIVSFEYTNSKEEKLIIKFPVSSKRIICLIKKIDRR